MGITHQQRQIRDRTIDAPGAPSDPYREAFISIGSLMQREEARLDRVEAALRALTQTVTELQAALREAVTRNAEPVTPDSNFVTEAVTFRNAYRNAERQRRYRERKKAHGADPQR